MKDYIYSIQTELANEEAYIVGGYLRDYLLNKTPNDIDLIVSGNIKEIVDKIANKTESSYFSLGDEQEKIIRLILPNGFEIDFSPLQYELKQDLLKRDFTINALAYDLKDYDQKIYCDKIIDLVEGKKDLKQGIVRVISEENIISDPLRVLRAFRIAAKLNFSLDSKTKEIVTNYVSDLVGIAGERIAMELQKLLSLRGAASYIKEIINIGIWQQLFNVNISMNQINKLTKLYTIINKIKNKQLEEYLSSKVGFFRRKEIIKLAILITKDKHQLVSKRLKLGNKASDLLRLLLVKQELVRKVIEKPTKINVYKLYQQVGKDGLGLLLMSLLNSQGWKEQNCFVEQIINYYNQSEIINPLQMVNGEDLLEELNLEPGPMIGRLLKEIKLAQIQGKISSYEEAINWAKDLINNY